MPHPLRSLLLAATLLAPALLLPAQSIPDQSAPAPTPHTLIERAIAFEKSDKSKTRYTYFELDHGQNRDHKGKLFADNTKLYENIWIADLPYKRLVELNGKPLTGDDLAREQARYDQAVAEHSGLGTEARAKIERVHLVNANIHLASLLTPAYTLTEFRQESIAGNLAHVIDCTPVSSTDPLHPTPTKHYEFWITNSGAILRTIFDILADEPEMLHGSHGQFDSQLIDGNLLPLHDLMHFYTPNTGANAIHFVKAA